MRKDWSWNFTKLRNETGDGVIVDAKIRKVLFVIFSPWKVLWNWIASSQNSFNISPSLLYHLIRRETGRLSSQAFASNAIVSLKKYLSGLKITNLVKNVKFLYIQKKHTSAAYMIRLRFAYIWYSLYIVCMYKRHIKAVSVS